jgi:hypothetical protein
MIDRLALGLIENARALAGEGAGDGSPPSWLLIEGLDPVLAARLVELWPASLPPIFVAGPADADFGDADLARSSATRERNRGGMCLVICEGERVPDGQSVRGFEQCGLEQLSSAEGAARLAAQPPSAAGAEGLDAVLAALADPKLEAPPSAKAIASFLDEVAGGRTVPDALPQIGGFRDDVAPASLRRERVIENMNLAFQRSSAERLAPSALAEVRERAERQSIPLGAEHPGERVIEMLLNRDDAMLRELSFAEAVAILEQPPPSELAAQVKRDLDRYADGNPDVADELRAEAPLAELLDDPLQRKDAAERFLELDAAHQGELLSPATRKRLRAQRRDRSVSEGAIEAGLIRAIDSLSSTVKSIDLREPAAEGGGSSESALKAIVSIASLHVRLAPLLRRLAGAGANVSALLLAEPGPSLSGALSQLQSRGAVSLRTVKLRVRGHERGDAVEVVWTPPAEELGILASLSAFAAAEPPCLALDSGDAEGGLALASLAPADLPPDLRPLADRLRATAVAILREGLEPGLLRSWAQEWSSCVGSASSSAALSALASAGSVLGDSGCTMTPLAPLKAEWLAARADAWIELLSLAALSASGESPKMPGDSLPAPISQTARAVGTATAAGYPGFVAVPGRQAPLLPAAEGTVLASFGDHRLGRRLALPPIGPIKAALGKLVDLHPEAAEHLRCAAWEGGCDLLVRAVLDELRRSRRVGVAEVFCIGGSPSAETLAALDEFVSSEGRRRIQLRYLESTAEWPRVGKGPQVHLALLEGITSAPERVNANIESVPPPPEEQDVLFAPRTWVLPNRARVLLAPPRLSPTGLTWHRLMTAILDDEALATQGSDLRVPELRADAATLEPILRELHDRSLWVATLDRYATRSTVEKAVGPDVAILHQERRVSGDSAFGLVISQRAGGTTDRAISRSLRGSGLLDETAATGVAQGLRRAASRGYGILALRAATTGSGINELIGHVAAFHRLTSDATPWPLPAGCRLILISLDEYAGWFGAGKRADLLALALSPEERGIHAANIEVKAVKGEAVSGRPALVEAREQLRKTIVDFRFAAYPRGSLLDRLWLNRIAEAAIGVCRENDTRLSAEDLAALDGFRVGEGVLEWAGVAMVFVNGPPDPPALSHMPLMGDRIPLLQTMVRLTPDLLEQAASSNGTRLRTVSSARPSLASSSKERRVGRLEPRPEAAPLDVEPAAEEAAVAGRESPVAAPAEGTGSAPPSPVHPSLGWDAATGEEIEWRVTGPDALSNGHMEIYGTSGAGKTQFVMSLLMHLRGIGSRFGVCDFKSDYGGTFPDRSGATFYDLWEESLPFNPLAIENPTRRNLQALAIELRDAVDIAARSYARLGHRQLSKLQQAFEVGFEQARQSGTAAPTLQDIHELLDEDLRGVIGDLTGTGLFGAGPPLGSLIERDAIFGLNRIPGTGITTTLAAGFILASLYLKALELPQVANRVSYACVIDEAHRVAQFHSVRSMVRELRSKGVAVILATQTPGELPEEASTNAQTKVYLRLPGAQAARDAARALDPADRDLPEIIRTLGDGEAVISLAGQPPRLARLRQFWRDDAPDRDRDA